MKTQLKIIAAAITLTCGVANADVPGMAAAWASAVNSDDKASLASLYTTDAVLVSPGSEIVSAPAAISEFWSAKRKSGANGFHLVNVNERTEGDTIYQSAVWASSFVSNGKTTEFEGQMTNVLVRQPDGRWKIQLQTWN